jgi:hypothetical protein
MSPPSVKPTPGETEAPGPQRLTRGQIRLYAAGYAVLAAGSACSYWAYRVAVADELGESLMAQARDTKAYQRQMEYLGGKANVLGSDITSWFVGLWHGRNLAYTLAVLTLAVALVCFYTAFALPDLPPFGDDLPEGSDGTGKPGTGKS